MSVAVSEVRSQRTEVRDQKSESTPQNIRRVPVNRKLKLSKVSLWIKGAGALLLLLSLLGIFRHHDRIKFYDYLQEKKEIAANSPTARKLMQDFGFPDRQIRIIDRLSLHDVRFGPMGRSLAGSVEAKTADGKKRTVTDLMEFRSWAYSESPSYRWGSFILIGLGFMVDISLYLQERRNSALA